MKFVNPFESFMMYQNHEFLQVFVDYMIECEDRPKYFRDSIKSNDFYVYEM